MMASSIAGSGAPQRVSDHGIEDRIAGSAASEINAWTFPVDRPRYVYALHTTDGTRYTLRPEWVRNWRVMADPKCGRGRASLSA